MRRLALAVILMIASACTPAERLAWDALHDLPQGTTHAAICNSNPSDIYCGANASAQAEPQPQMTEHDILWQAINEKFPSSQWNTARRVAQCESGNGHDFKSIDMDAKSPTNDHGAFQINETTWNKPYHSDPVAQYIGQNWHNVYDPVTNTEMAYRIWEAYGWRMWSCA